MISSVTPASSGVPGPGESRMPFGAASATSALVVLSFKRTSHSQPSASRYCTRLYVNES